MYNYGAGYTAGGGMGNMASLQGGLLGNIFGGPQQGQFSPGQYDDEGELESEGMERQNNKGPMPFPAISPGAQPAYLPQGFLTPGAQLGYGGFGMAGNVVGGAGNLGGMVGGLVGQTMSAMQGKANDQPLGPMVRKTVS